MFRRGWKRLVITIALGVGFLHTRPPDSLAWKKAFGEDEPHQLDYGSSDPQPKPSFRNEFFKMSGRRVRRCEKGPRDVEIRVEVHRERSVPRPKKRVMCKFFTNGPRVKKRVNVEPCGELGDVPCRGRRGDNPLCVPHAQEGTESLHEQSRRDASRKSRIDAARNECLATCRDRRSPSASLRVHRCDRWELRAALRQ